MTPLRFKHIIIDPEGPLDPHIKAVGDLIGVNWSGDYQPVEMWQQIPE